MLELNLLCDLGSLAYATAQVVQLSTANLTAANNLELSNVRGMYREGLLYAYAVRNAANGYGLVYASVLLSNLTLMNDELIAKLRDYNIGTIQTSIQNPLTP